MAASVYATLDPELQTRIKAKADELIASGIPAEHVLDYLDKNSDRVVQSMVPPKPGLSIFDQLVGPMFEATPTNILALPLSFATGELGGQLAAKFLPGAAAKRLAVEFLTDPAKHTVMFDAAARPGLEALYSASQMLIHEDPRFVASLARSFGASLPFALSDSIEALKRPEDDPKSAFASTVATFALFDTALFGLGSIGRGLSRLLKNRISEELFLKTAAGADLTARRSLFSLTPSGVGTPAADLTAEAIAGLNKGAAKHIFETERQPFAAGAHGLGTYRGAPDETATLAEDLIHRTSGGADFRDFDGIQGIGEATERAIDSIEAKAPDKANILRMTAETLPEDNPVASTIKTALRKKNRSVASIPAPEGAAQAMSSAASQTPAPTTLESLADAAEVAAQKKPVVRTNSQLVEDKITSGDKDVAKMRMLGYSDDQIVKASPAGRNRIAANNFKPSEVSILQSGDVKAIAPVGPKTAAVPEMVPSEPAAPTFESTPLPVLKAREASEQSFIQKLKSVTQIEVPNPKTGKPMKIGQPGLPRMSPEDESATFTSETLARFPKDRVEGRIITMPVGTTFTSGDVRQTVKAGDKFMIVREEYAFGRGRTPRLEIRYHIAKLEGAGEGVPLLVHEDVPSKIAEHGLSITDQWAGGSQPASRRLMAAAERHIVDLYNSRPAVRDAVAKQLSLDPAVFDALKSKFDDALAESIISRSRSVPTMSLIIDSARRFRNIEPTAAPKEVIASNAIRSGSKTVEQIASENAAAAAEGKGVIVLGPDGKAYSFETGTPVPVGQERQSEISLAESRMQHDDELRRLRFLEDKYVNQKPKSVIGKELNELDQLQKKYGTPEQRNIMSQQSAAKSIDVLETPEEELPAAAEPSSMSPREALTMLNRATDPSLIEDMNQQIITGLYEQAAVKGFSFNETFFPDRSLESKLKIAGEFQLVHDSGAGISFKPSQIGELISFLEKFDPNDASHIERLKTDITWNPSGPRTTRTC